MRSPNVGSAVEIGLEGVGLAEVVAVVCLSTRRSSRCFEDTCTGEVADRSVEAEELGELARLTSRWCGCSRGRVKAEELWA